MKIKGAEAGSSFGASVSGARDINGDDIDDIIIGASQESNTGTAHVIFGSKSLASEIDLSSGFDGYSIIGGVAGDYFGAAVSTAGDVNGDGLGDLIVGANNANSGAGTAYLLLTPFVCLIKCATCETFSKCLTCNPGYGLEGGQCIECPSSTELVDGLCVPVKSQLEIVTEVSKGLFDSGSAASRLFTMGRSLSVGLGLIAKIIQNVRFLDIDYDEKTLDAFKTYGTDLFELPIPETFYESPETKELSSPYARYDMEPSFLENYWDTITMMLISLACFVLIKFIQFLMKAQRKDHILQVALRKIGQTFANYFIIQIYSNLDDVTFFLFLDIQNTRLSSPSAGISLAMGIFFLLVGLSLVFFHCWLLGKYQQAKSQGNLERFEARYGILGTLYEDFKDDNFTKQSFFGILILRCVILILVITLLKPPLVQAIVMMVTNLIFLIYFIYNRPLKSLFDEIVQYFCELTIFAAYLCALILSILDAETAGNSSLRSGLGKCIVMAGIVLALGGFIVQVIQLIGAIIGIWRFFKTYNRQKVKVKVFLSPIIDPIQNHQDSISDNSSILKHINPRNVSEQLELMNTSQKITQRPISFDKNDLKSSVVTNHDENVILTPCRQNMSIWRLVTFSNMALAIE